MPDSLDLTRLDLCVYWESEFVRVESGASHPGSVFFQLFAVDLFTKYSALGLDDVADHAWADDTVLYVWTSCFCIGVIGACIVNNGTGELLHSVAGSLQFASVALAPLARAWFVSDTGPLHLAGCRGSSLVSSQDLRADFSGGNITELIKVTSRTMGIDGFRGMQIRVRTCAA